MPLEVYGWINPANEGNYDLSSEKLYQLVELSRVELIPLTKGITTTTLDIEISNAEAKVELIPLTKGITTFSVRCCMLPVNASVELIPLTKGITTVGGAKYRGDASPICWINPANEGNYDSISPFSKATLFFWLN